jgi:membrane protein YdbS with pleckstrin-like domain
VEAASRHLEHEHAGRQIAPVAPCTVHRAPRTAHERVAAVNLDPRYIPFQRAVGWIVTASVAAGSLVALLVFLIAEWPSVVIAAMLVVLWAVGVAGLGWFCYRWPELEYRFTSYTVDDQGIEIHSGVYWRAITNVPRSRVQHTDVAQGPMQRRYGLGTLVVYTAGTEHAMVALPGLAHQDALQIRDHLLPREGADAV